MAFMKQVFSLAFVAIVLLMQNSEARPRRHPPPPPPPCLVEALNGTVLETKDCPDDSNCTVGPFPGKFGDESVQVFRCSKDGRHERPDHPPPFMACLLVNGDDVIVNVSCTEDAPCTRGPYDVTVNETVMEATFCECESGEEPDFDLDGKRVDGNEEIVEGLEDDSRDEVRGGRRGRGERRERGEREERNGGRGGRGGRREKRSPRSHRRRPKRHCGPVTLLKPEVEQEREPEPMKYGRRGRRINA